VAAGGGPLWISRLVSLSLLAVVLFSAGRAMAGDAAAQAEPLIRRGLTLRQQGKDELALPFFQKAYELVRTPRTEGQLGLVEMALGYWIDADHHLTEVLAAGDHPWVAKNRKALDDALGRVRRNIGSIVIEGAPAGAALFVNGLAVGTAPLGSPIRVAKGKVDVEVRASGFLTATSTLEVRGGDEQRVVMALEKEKPAVETPAQPPPVAEIKTATAGEGGDASDAHGPRDERAGGTLRRKLAWSTAIGAGLVLAAAVTETVIWQQKRASFENHLGPPADNPSLDSSLWKKDCGTADLGHGATACQSLYDAARRAQTVAVIGYAVGGALVVTSSVLFLGGGGRRDQETKVACGPGALLRGFSCNFSF
jgi:hypothetical protein